MRRSASNGRMCRSRRSSRIASMRIISPSASSWYRSGWNSRVVSRSARANVRATSRLPTPGGPWKRYACAGPSVSAASSSRPASGCSEKRANVLTDLLCDLLLGARAVEHDDPLRLCARELAVGSVDALHELDALALDAVVVVAGPRERLLGVEQDEERSIRQQLLGDEQAEVAHLGRPETARDSLVGDRRVEVAVAHDVLAAFERRADHVRRVVRPGRGVERRLGPRGHV